MELLIYLLICYGISNILVFGSIFEWWREFIKKFGNGSTSLNKLFSCMMCLPFWVGVGISYLLISMGYDYIPPATSIGIKEMWLSLFLDGVLTSGAVWIIHTIQEHFEV